MRKSHSYMYILELHKLHKHISTGTLKKLLMYSSSKMTLLVNNEGHGKRRGWKN